MARGVGRSGELGLGEMIEALVSLKPNPAGAERIATALGFGWKVVQSDQTAALAPATATASVSTPELHGKSGTVQAAAKELQPVRAATTSLELRPSDPQAAASGPLAAGDARSHSARPLYRPLFLERRWRALARAMLATQMETDTIDVRIVIKHLRTGRPIDKLPWLQKRTLKRGVVLILDRSQSMQPFWRDEGELVERCKRVVGGPGVRSYVVETNLWSNTGAVLRWLQPEPQRFAAQMPVVIVSDFELGTELTPRFAVLSPWIPLIERATSAGATVLALIPVSRTLWPAALFEVIPNAIVWDNDTTTGAVRRSTTQRG